MAARLDLFSEEGGYTLVVLHFLAFFEVESCFEFSDQYLTR